MKSGTFEALVENGAIEFASEEELLDYLASLGTASVNVSIKPHQASRSDKQNRYYFGVVVKGLSEYLGYSKDEIHELLKHKFLHQWGSIETLDGLESIEFTKSTTVLTTTEMEKYLRDIREWASMKLNYYLPEPNEDEK